MSRHTHLHANVQRTMSRFNVTADIEHLFAVGADTVSCDELETEWHHHEFKRCAEKHGYDFFVPSGAAGALAIAVKKSYGKIVYSADVLAAPGKSGVSPNRYSVRVRIRRHADGAFVMVNEHHAYSSGWTGSKYLDSFRRLRWYTSMRVVNRINRRATKINAVVIGSGDLNRPPSTFPKGKVLGGMLKKTGMRSAGRVKTDSTHGRETFDYLWFLSRNHNVRVVKWSTPVLHSDHDGILATLEW